MLALLISLALVAEPAATSPLQGCQAAKPDASWIYVCSSSLFAIVEDERGCSMERARELHRDAAQALRERSAQRRPGLLLPAEEARLVEERKRGEAEEAAIRRELGKDADVLRVVDLNAFDARYVYYAVVPLPKGARRLTCGEASPAMGCEAILVYLARQPFGEGPAAGTVPAR